MTGAQVIYGACAASFLALIALVLLRGRISSRGLLIVGAAGLTTLWGGDLALDGFLPNWAGPILNSLRLSAWLIVAVILFTQRDPRKGVLRTAPILAAVSLSAVIVGSQAGILLEAELLSAETARLIDILYVGVAVGGLLAIENVLRNVDDARRRKLWPLCVAIGATFAFELFVYANSLMLPGAGPMMLEGRGLIGIAAVPLIAITIVRNREWGIDIHVSRTVVLHTAALVTTGLFFLGLSATAVLVRNFGGGWGPALQIVVLLGSAVVLVTVLGARDLRIRLKQFISRHFFSNRFDYRAEWLRFVDTVSRAETSDEDLPLRVVRALAQIIDGRAGGLWRLDQSDHYAVEAGWNLPIAYGQSFATGHPFISGFHGGERVQVQTKGRGDPLQLSGSWIGVPLLHNSRMLGFVVLMLPHAQYALDEEVYELLRTAGKQAGSYLAEAEAAQALFDARLITEFGKRFTFAVHDLKNLASQLGLMLENARRHLDNPAYREDMLLSLEDASTKLARLVGQLRAGKPSPDRIEPDILIRDLADQSSRLGHPVRTELAATDCAVRINGEQFRSILHHLLDNAREASRSEDGRSPPILVSSRVSEAKVVVDVTDSGPGMEEAFIRDELFRPFRSTKDHGFGIGAYQTREVLRMAGGDLTVISEKGVGTTMRMTLPLADRLHLIPAA